MNEIFLNTTGRSVLFNTNDICLSTNERLSVADLLDNLGLSFSECFIIHNGCLATRHDVLCNGHTYNVVPRILGGKGGFGSMLRAIGAQIEKTTNREACRDLSGRRMRDVNNEKSLRDWVSKKAEREKDKDQRRRERLERRKAVPRHNFDDPEYEQQKGQVNDNLQDAVLQGLQKAGTSGSSASATVTSEASSRKRKSDRDANYTAKKVCEWLGADINDSDLDSDDSDAMAGSSGDSEGDHHAGDSGVESVKDHSLAAAQAMGMEVDSDCSAKDSAMTLSEPEQGVSADTKPSSQDQRHTTDDLASNSSNTETCSAAVEEIKSKPHPLLASLETLIPNSEAHGKPEVPIVPEEADLEQFESVAQLEALGLDTLKAILTCRGLKCGGTLQERAERLWTVRGLSPHEIDPSLKAGKGKGKKKGR